MLDLVTFNQFVQNVHLVLFDNHRKRRLFLLCRYNFTMNTTTKFHCTSILMQTNLRLCKYLILFLLFDKICIFIFLNHQLQEFIKLRQRAHPLKVICFPTRVPDLDEMGKCSKGS